jgi:uncharacterized spore protein YtfJ
MATMEIQKAIAATREVFSAKRVYGEPYERDGVTVIPAAWVAGGGGGGGDEQEGRSSGGTGYGLFARPVGAYVVKDGEVEWRPAFDRTAMIVTVGTILVAALRVARAYAERR